MSTPAVVLPLLRPRAVGLVPLAALLLVTVSCGDDGGGGVAVPALEIRTTTSGTELDPDGYAVTVDGGEARPIGIVDTLIIDPLAEGAHAVTLTGLAPNCGVAGDNPVTATVAPDTTAEVAFAVICAGTTGSVEVSVATTGSPADPDGYTVTLDAADPGLPVGSNGTVSFGAVPVGSHAVALGGLAPNCVIQGETSRAIEVTPGGAVTVAFSVTCAAPPTLIAFTSNAFALLAIFVVNPDGSGLRKITSDGVFERSPVWSPDGSRMLFVQVDEFTGAEALYIRMADGSGRRKLVDAEQFGDYRWSPDGGRIAYAATRSQGGDVFSDLWIIRRDGSGKVRLVTNAEGPSWSPDGGRIAYVSDQTDLHIRIINSDGSGDRRLTARSLSAFQPAWSPDGSRIAFVSLNPNEIRLINPDGSGLENLTQGLGQEDSPTWSPDGSKLAFNTGPMDQPLESDVAVINRDGSGRTNLTNRPGFDLSPDWSPDGSRIVYVRDQDFDNEIYVMNADGSGPTNVSNRPDAFDFLPDWGGASQTMVASRVSKSQLRGLRMPDIRDPGWRLPRRAQ